MFEDSSVSEGSCKLIDHIAVNFEDPRLVTIRRGVS